MPRPVIGPEAAVLGSGSPAPRGLAPRLGWLQAAAVETSQAGCHQSRLLGPVWRRSAWGEKGTLEPDDAVHKGHPDCPRTPHFDLRLLFHLPVLPLPPPTPPLGWLFISWPSQANAQPVPNSHCRGYALLSGEAARRWAGGSTPCSSWSARRCLSAACPQLNFIS